MIFSIKITSQDGEIIDIGNTGEEDKNFITDIEIHMDTVNDNVSNKSNAMLAKIKIFGNIQEDINSELLKLFEWSKELNQDKWYRTLEIKIKPSIGKKYRTYIFEKVFVVDYLECYGNNTENDHFELYLTQKENNFRTIEAY